MPTVSSGKLKADSNARTIYGYLADSEMTPVPTSERKMWKA
jgi:hypothetical protein